MESELDFDPTLYSRLPPYLDLASTLALARQLIAAAPARPSPGAKRTLVSLGRATQSLSSSMIDSLAGSEVADKRPVDLRTDRSWSALERRLSAWTDLPADEYPEVEQAQTLHQLLFPDGLRFTQLEYGAQWAEAEARIGRIRRDGLESPLERLCGKAFLAELLLCHAAYGVMVGTTRQAGERAGKEPTESTDLNGLRKKVHQAILAHQVQLVAMCMSGDLDEGTAARRALRPVDEYREKLSPSRPRPRDPEPPADSPPAAAPAFAPAPATP